MSLTARYGTTCSTAEYDATFLSKFTTGHYTASFSTGCALFTDEEMYELESTNVKVELQPDEDTEACINAFNMTSVGEIREAMNLFTSRRGANYDVQKDFSIDTITYAIHSLALLYERQPNALSTDNHESWHINIWGLIIDQTFEDEGGRRW
ncbi:hypothetical protein BC938DRAFT_477305 [Jimgerdemannia flammicorona]|uniref:Uncharacterized protein n=1 Tax=Jimgerdemannia flammicorona TaxID=994334 RepID=A0A433QPI8_9FUNG|nr:hypothetical protein BC938DRAFT_477305 [Jimgerdemannia flammicorona]